MLKNLYLVWRGGSCLGLFWDFYGTEYFYGRRCFVES